MKKPTLPIIVRPSTAYVPVYDRTGVCAYAIISPAKVPLVEGKRWNRDRKGYVFAHAKNAEGKQTTVKLHRVVMGDPPGMDVDHRSQDKLDNRDDSLRVCTHAQNMMNHPGRLGRARGVRQMKGGRWHARLMVSRVDHHLGAFDTQEEAIAARRAAELKMRGEFAPPAVPC